VVTPAWKRFVDHISSLLDVNRKKLTQLIDQADNQLPTIKCTGESLDASVYKGERFINESVLGVHTHFKPTKTFQPTNSSSCHPAGVKNGFIKGVGGRLRLLRTKASKVAFKEKSQLQIMPYLYSG